MFADFLIEKVDLNNIFGSNNDETSQPNDHADALYTRLEAKNKFSFLQPFELGHVHQVFRFLYLTGYETTNNIRKVQEYLIIIP